MRKSLIISMMLMLLPAHAEAVSSGKIAKSKDGLRRSVIRIENTTGELCSGLLLSAEIAITAAHCVAASGTYRAVFLDKNFHPYSINISVIRPHRTFAPKLSPHQQTGADLALVKLTKPVPNDMLPLKSLHPIALHPGTSVYLSGYGSIAYDKAKTARTLRIAELKVSAVDQPPNQVIFATDPNYEGRLPGAGACRGDSGAPIWLQTQYGYHVGGIVSWSSGAQFAKNNSPCGGITVITPIAPYVDWINKTLDELSGDF